MIQEQITHMAAPELPATNAPARGRRTLAAAGIAVAVVVAALLIGRHTSRTAADVGPPFNVDGTRVSINEHAPTWSYLEFASASPQEPVSPAPVPARVAFAEARAAPVVAPLPGRIDAVPVRLGQRVVKGDRLVAIRSPDLVDLSKELELKRTEEAARAKVVERLRALVDLRAEPTRKLIDAQQELAQAQLAQQAAELKLRSLAVAPEDSGLYWLLAPRDGVVVQRDVLIGQQVGPERAEPLMVIAEIDEVIVTADVPEADVAGLQVGESAEVLPTGGTEPGVAGRVEYVGEVVDPQRRMVEVRVRVPNPERLLRPNAFVQVAFAPGTSQRIVIPSEAVVTDDQQSFVFVRNADQPGTLERREVVLGRQRGGKVEIVHGLAPGETYATKGAILLLNAVDLASQ